MKILVDDIRELSFLGISPSATVYRTGEDFLENIPEQEITTLFIDHDLGEGINGYKVVTELIEIRNTKPWSVIIVSSNPVGVENIGRCLEANGYRKLNSTTFMRD
jgi:hypothetical protein